ncbi:MAG: hypothetical protein WD226_06240 [Planctomycetota bacterium]
MRIHSSSRVWAFSLVAALSLGCIVYVLSRDTLRQVELRPSSAERKGGEYRGGRQDHLVKFSQDTRGAGRDAASTEFLGGDSAVEAGPPWDDEVFWTWVAPSRGADGVAQLEEVMPHLVWGIATGNCNSYDKYVELCQRIFTGYASHFADMGGRASSEQRMLIADLAHDYRKELNLHLNDYIEATLRYRQAVLRYKTYDIASPGQRTNRQGVGSCTMICLGWKADFGWEPGLCPEFDRVEARIANLTNSYRARAVELLR